MDYQLTITWKDGRVAVTGPVDQPLLCYGLLEVARDVIFARALEQAPTTRIVPARLVPILRDTDGGPDRNGL